MDFFSKVLAANGISSSSREKAKEAEQVNKHFKANLGNLKSRLESPDVIDFLDMVYDTSFSEDKEFLKTPSRSSLSSKKELVLQLLVGLDSLGVPVMAEMRIFTEKYGPEEIADSLMILLYCFSPLLEGKELPQYSTDDVMHAIDFQWHSPSGKGSPLLNMLTSAGSSPRAKVPGFHQGKSNEKPSLYSLDKVPGLQRRRPRKSSSLKNANDELRGESASGAPTKRNSALARSRSASMSFEEICREKNLQSKDYEASMQKALATTDDSWHKEGSSDLNRSLDEGDYVALNTKSVNNVKLEKPELLGQADERENLRPVDVSDPRAVDEHPRGSAQFEKSFSGADAADGVCGDNPLVNNSEPGKMRADDKIVRVTLVETATAGGQTLDKEQMQKVITKTLSKEKSEHDSTGNVGNTLAKEATMEECSRSAAEQQSANGGGSLTADSVGDRDMPADFIGLAAHRENQQDVKGPHVSPPSKTVDPVDSGSLRGHPTSSSSSTPRQVDFPLKSDQHDRDFSTSDPATKKREVQVRAPSIRKGGRLGKLATNCLGCFSKPQTT